jgi:hypothetical protein
MRFLLNDKTEATTGAMAKIKAKKLRKFTSMPHVVQPIAKGITARKNLDKTRCHENWEKKFKRF